MTPEQREANEAKDRRLAERRERTQQREAERAAKAEARRKREEERKAEAEERRLAKEAKQRESDQTAEIRNQIADAVLAACTELRLKTPAFKKFVKEQGETLSVNEEGAATVLDARGQNPVSVADYVAQLDEDTVASMRKTETKRKTGWPQREKKERVKPEDHGVVDISRIEPGVEIDADKPWASFPLPTGVRANIHSAKMKPNMAGEGDNEYMAGLRLEIEGVDRGSVDKEAARELGRMIGFKIDFVEKIGSTDPQLAAQVVNHVIGQYRPQVMAFIVEGDRVRDICPGWRDAASHAEVCQAAYNALAAHVEGKEIQVDKCKIDGDGHLELLLTYDAGTGQVTPKEGDYLRAGVRVTHRFGSEVKCGLYTKRCICDNGMTVETTAYGWSSKGAGAVADQLVYVGTQVVAALNGFDALVANCRKMAETKIQADPQAALKERMRQMGVPMKYLPAVVEAFGNEPGDTEWDMLNAITRFATHAMGIGRNMRDALMEASGCWVRDFDVVKARMPRSIARRVGAEIIAE